MSCIILSLSRRRRLTRGFSKLEKVATVMTTETLRSSAHCGLFIDRVVAFDKSENQEWPFARILVLGKFSVCEKAYLSVEGRIFVLTYSYIGAGFLAWPYANCDAPRSSGRCSKTPHPCWITRRTVAGAYERRHPSP